MFERDGLGVLQVLVDVEALARDLAFVVNYDAPDERAGAHLPRAARGEFERARHHAFVRAQSCRFRVQS